MYKIYVNDRPLLLADSAEAEALDPASFELVARYPGKAKFLLNYIDLLEKARHHKGVLLHWENLEELKKDLFHHFKLEEAAGGIVQNPHRQVLFIFRRGFWDLPKGKIDPGETRREAAVREVMEETGLREVQLGDPLPTTYHTYRQANRRYLKITYWYRMFADQQELVPEAGEQIEKAEWHEPASFIRQAPRMHRNILELLAFYRQQNDLG
jgi:8-oxo-dGTP pyrophosphatase MutT (NUDIX family)